MISDLQLSLLGAGLAGVVIVWGYNAWQERKYRKAAEQVFRRSEPDPLAQREAQLQQGTDLTANVTLDDERIEPSLGMPENLPAGEDGDAAQPQFAPASELAPPDDLVDPTIELVAALHLHPPLAGDVLIELRDALTVAVSKPVRIIARADREWSTLEAGNAGCFVEARATALLADRRGPLNSAELDAFINGLETFAARTHAALDRFVGVSVSGQAQALDAFCASVDLQIALHVVPSGAEGFPGTKLRGLIEALGFQPGADGIFQMSDEAGHVLLTLSNFDSTPLVPDQLKASSVQGLSFWLDVPRVPQGGATYDRMVDVAQKLAAALGGILVDDQRGPLAGGALVAIRRKIVEIQDEMNAAGMPAGGRRALRLFA